MGTYKKIHWNYYLVIEQDFELDSFYLIVNYSECIYNIIKNLILEFK